MTALSKSLLWQKMEEYYSNIGPSAWADEVVPMQISSNKSLGFAYANIILAQINDWYLSKKTTTTTEPFYIIEVGAGHGKLSFYVIKALLELLEIYEYPATTVKYVITDIAKKNIDSMRSHPAFSSFIEKGVIDFACFNATADTEITLQVSNKVLTAKSINTPIFAICNYLIDSLAHDAFVVDNGKLFEVSLDLTTVDNWQEYFSNPTFKFSRNLITKDYYADPNLNKILEFYTSHFEQASFLIPVGGFSCLNTISNFSNAPLISLIADKGCASLELFQGMEDPDITLHGSSSMLVNFDALARYYAFNNGTALTMPNSSADFQVAAFITQHDYKIAATKLSFLQNFSGASPQDLVNICYYDDSVREDFDSIDEILAILNLNHWDLNVLYDLHDPLIEMLEANNDDEDDEDADEDDENSNQLTTEQMQCIKDNLEKAWGYFFKLEKNVDIPFAIAVIYYNLEDFEQAIKFYNISIQEFGMNTENTYNLAITYQLIGEKELATKFAKLAVKIDPEYEDAIDLIAELEEELATV